MQVLQKVRVNEISIVGPKLKEDDDNNVYDMSSPALKDDFDPLNKFLISVFHIPILSDKIRFINSMTTTNMKE